MSKKDEIYTGETKKGKRNGFGRCDYADGSWYAGEWKNGKKHGQGCEINKSGISYMGRYTDGEYDSFGTLFPVPGNKDQVLTSGQFSKEAFNGIGLVLNEHGGPSYAGQLIESGMSGIGCWYHPNGTVIAGENKDTKSTAVSLEIYADGSHSLRHYLNGILHGDVINWSPDGTRTVCKFAEGEQQGPCEIFKHDGTIIVALSDHKGFQGEVMFIYSDGYNVKKNYKDDRPFGDVIVTGPDGTSVTISQKEAKRRGI